MSARTARILLFVYALLYFIVFTLYFRVESTLSMAYYPFGLVHLGIITAMALTLLVFARKNIFVHYKKLTYNNIFLFFSYTLLIVICSWKLSEWFAVLL